MDIIEKNDGNGSDHNDETASNDDDEPELMVVDEDFCNAESGAEEEVENAEIICETSTYKVEPELIIIDDDSGTSTENNKLNGNSQLITPTSMENLPDKIKKEKLSDDESVHNDTTESNENEDEMELIVIDDDRSSESFKVTSEADYSNAKNDNGNNINLTEKQKACMNDDKNICPTYNQITSTTEGKIISCAEKQIVSVSTDKLASITEDKQIPISTNKPASIAEDKPASTAKDKPASITEDKPTSIAEGKLASIIEDKPASTTENQSISSTKDKPGSMLESKLTSVSKDKLISLSEDKLTSVSENKLTSVSENKLISVSENKLTSVSENKLTSVSENKLTSISKHKLTPTSKQKLTAILEDKLTTIPEDKLTSISENKLTSFSNNKLTPISKDKLTSVSEDKLTSIPEDKPTSILEGRPESISKGIRVSVAKDIPMFISENNSVSVAEDKSVSISNDKSVSITENKSTFFVENKSGPCAKDKLESSIVNKPVPLIEKKLGSFCENKSKSHVENKPKSLTENNSGPFIENQSENFAKRKSEFITENKSKSLSEDKSQFSTKVGLETPMGNATILPTEEQRASAPINDILSFLKESVIDELLCDELYIKDNKAFIDENKPLSQSTSKKISLSKSKEMLSSEGGSALKNTEIKDPSTTSEVQPSTEKQSVCVVKDSQDNPKTCDPDTGGSAQNTTEIKEPGTTSEVQPSTEKQSVCVGKDSQDNPKTCDSDIGGSAPKTTEIKEPSTTSEVQPSTEKQSVCVVKNSQDNPKTCDPDTGNTVVEQGDLSHMLECHLEIGAPSVEWAEMVQNWQKLQDPTLSLTTEGRPETIHKIPEGNAKLGKDGFFNIKVLFTGTKKSYSFYGPNGHRLMMILKAEKFLVDPVKWLIDKKIAAEITRCSACLCTQLRQIRTQVYNDGYAWVCLNPQCQHVYPFVRPPFFNKFNHSLGSLLAAIFHWAFQSHHQHAMTDTSLSMPELMTLYQTLQEICSLYTDNYDRDSKRVVKPYDIIEIAVYQFGSFLILALYERNAKLVRLQIIPFDEKHFVNAFLKFSASFIDRNHMVVSDCSLLEKLKIPCMGFAYPNPYITNEDDTGWHCLNVNSFFKQHVAGIFKKYRANSVNVEVWQGFLNEVEWRQRYGILNEMAFWGMLYCLSKKQAGAQSFERIIEPMVQTFSNQGTHSPTLPKTSNKARKSCFGQKTKLQDLSTQVNNDVGDSNVIDVESDARNGALFTQGGSTMKMNENEKRAITGSPSSFNVSKDINISDIYTSNNSLVDSSVSSTKPPQSDIMSSVMFQPDGLDAVTVTALLSIRTWPLVRYLLELLRVTKQPDNFDATVWRNKLKAEGFFNQPLKWLVDHGFAPGNTHCDKCQSNAVNCGENEQVYLTCRDHRCCYIQPFKRPKFFAKFGFPMKDLLFLLFHWVAQSPFQAICQDVFLTEYKVRYVFWGVQKHCLAVLLQDPKLGNPGHVIEVGIIQYGEFCILGALNKQTKETRLKALYAPLVYKSCVFEPTLNDWLCKGSTIMTSHNPFQLKDHKVIYTTEPNAPYDSKTITLYLKSVVCALFSQYSTIGIKVDIIQSFLDEIVWRQKYGHTPELAFISLLQQFSESELGYDRLIPQGKPVLSNSASPALNKDPLLSDNPVTAENPDTSFPISNNPSSKGKQLSSRKEIMTGKRKSSRLAASNHENVLCIEDNNDESNPDEPTSCKKQKLINKTEVLKIPALSAEQNKSAGVLISKYSRAEFCKKFRDEEFPEFEEYFQNQPSAVSEVRSNCLLSLEKEGGKLLKPLIVDSMQFLKNPKKQKKNYQKDECKNIVPLDEYYFAEMKSKVLPPLEPGSYVYSCTFCKIYLFGNIEVIDHTLKHIADMREKSKPKTFSCPFFIHRYISSASCLYEFSTKEERKKHVTDVHSTDSLSCLICSLPFRSSADLSQHMKRSHFPCEMPYTCPVCVYRSSLHKEVLEHFQLVHKDDPHLICPFCLKMCSPTRTDDPVLFTNAFSKHLFKHQDRGQNVKCPSCCLLFFTYEELYAHAIRDHASFLNSADAVCFKVRCSPFVVLTETLSNPVPASTCHPVAIFANAKMSELIVKNNQLDAEKKIQRKMQPIENRCQNPLKLMSNEPSPVNYESDIDTEVPLEPIPNLQSHASQLQDLMLLNDASKRTKTGEESPSFRYSANHPVRCFECGNQVTNNHFYKPLSCHCTYVTYCAKAFALHVIKKHFAEGDTIQTTKVFAKLKENGVCSCSFSSDNVDTLAAHLKDCTGFINVKSTEFITKHQKEGNKVSVLLRHLKSSSSGATQIALSHAERRDTNEQMGNMPPPNNFRIPDWQSIPQYLSNIPTSVSHPSTTSEVHRPVSTDTLEMLQRYSQQYLIPRSSAVSSLVVRETLNAQNANMYVPSPPPPPPPPPYPVHHPSYTLVPPKPNSRIKAGVMSVRNGITYIQEVPVAGRYPHSTPVQFGQRQGTSCTAGPHSLRPNILRNLLHDNALIGPSELPRRAVVIPNLNMQQRQQRQIQPTKHLQLRQQQFPVQLQQQSPIQLHQQPPIQLQQQPPIQLQQQPPIQLQQQPPIQLQQQPPIQLQQQPPTRLQQQPSKQPQQQQVQQPSSLNELKNLLTHIKQEKPD